MIQLWLIPAASALVFLQGLTFAATAVFSLTLNSRDAHFIAAVAMGTSEGTFREISVWEGVFAVLILALSIGLVRRWRVATWLVGVVEVPIFLFGLGILWLLLAVVFDWVGLFLFVETGIFGAVILVCLLLTRTGRAVAERRP
jgi:hypothetical protein